MALSSSLLNCALSLLSCSPSFAAASSSNSFTSCASLAWSFFMRALCSLRSRCTSPTRSLISAVQCRLSWFEGLLSNSLLCLARTSSDRFKLAAALALAAFSLALSVSSLEFMFSRVALSVSSRTRACWSCCCSMTLSMSASVSLAESSSCAAVASRRPAQVPSWTSSSAVYSSSHFSSNSISSCPKLTSAINSACLSLSAYSCFSRERIVSSFNFSLFKIFESRSL
mmetsp:Transcript_58185/g.131831  ORF Transcript_58185/g.131831 Transcript_58185/m.131831 type:complete len:227 (-) Transcript_58185:183-863(-)